MELPLRLLFATNTNKGNSGGNIFLSKWKLEKDDLGNYIRPGITSFGSEMWIPNVLDLKESEGPTLVRVIRATKETGLWIICYDGDYVNEQHLYNYQPKFSSVPGILDREWMEQLADLNPDSWEFLVDSNIEMKAGDGPFPATLKRLTSDIIVGL